jgi:hypothetical protein
LESQGSRQPDYESGGSDSPEYDQPAQGDGAPYPTDHGNHEDSHGSQSLQGLCFGKQNLEKQGSDFGVFGETYGAIFM